MRIQVNRRDFWSESFMKFDIVTIGDCQIDYFVRVEDYRIAPAQAGRSAGLVLNYAQKIPISEFKFFYGGNALNTAVGFRRLGLKVGIHACVGKDAGGSAILEHIRRENIERSQIRVQNGVETDKSVVIVTGGERTILTYHSRKNYNFSNRLQSKWVYLTSLGAGYEKIYKGVETLISRSAAKLAFNPGTRQLKHSIAAVRRLVKYTDLLFVNFEEAQKIAGGKTGDAKRLLARLNSLGAKNAIVTDGIKGAYAFDGKLFLKIGSFPAKRVDATGAGDAFASGTTAALVTGLSLGEALRWGSVNAASEIAQIGVQNGLLTKNRLLDVLKKHPGFAVKQFK